MACKSTKYQGRLKRALRVRRRLKKNDKLPRLCVVKSNMHLQAQIIDADQGITVVGVATFSKDFKGTEFGKKNCKSAAKIGTRIAELAKEKGIERVMFDRGPYKYHGILLALANSAREAGLQF